MEIFDALTKRQMTRAFTSQDVGRSVIESLVYAATRGPSAGNTASVDVLVLEGSQTASYWDETLPVDKRASFPWPGLLRAPVLLIPTVNPDDYVDRYGEVDKAHTGLGDSADAWSVPYWWVDGGAAVENVLLLATGLGLGACFFGQFEHEPAVAERFGIPKGRRSLGTIAIGHADVAQERPSASSQRPSRSVEQRTHWGQW